MWDNFRKITYEGASSAPSISTVMKKATCDEVKENRRHIILLLEATSYLGRQASAFRGNDESDGSPNRGNFNELVSTFAKIDPNLKARMERRYGTYTCHEYVNDYISLFGNAIREDVANGVKKAGFFSVLVDETKDFGRKEQLSIFFRYFDGKRVCERSIGCFHMKDLTAYSNIIKSFESCRKQNYFIISIYFAYM